MNLREITIGRSGNCDIYLDARCRYASGLHATIYYDGSQLMFRDTSTNGTLINNVNVHKRAVPINHGDIIMIASKYPISWNQIDSFFPSLPQPSPSPARVMGTMAESAQMSPVMQPQPNLSKWNWGAFFMTWIWGLFNGCWWLLPVQLLLVLCAFIPIVNLFTGIISIAVVIICGIKGTEWAWNNRQWVSVQDFEDTQRTWAKVSIALFCIGLLCCILSCVLFLNAILSVFG